jgi:hypothetical protein
MNLIERVKKIIVEPKNEWVVIDQEETQVTELVTGYLVVLALIPAVAVFLRYGLFGFGHVFEPSISWGLKQAIISFVSAVGGAFLSAWVIDALAPSFNSTKNFRKAIQLVVYSYTPMMLAGVFQLIPVLSILGIVGLYGLYLLYLGISPLMKTPEDKVVGYFIVSLLVIVIIYVVLFAILGALLVGGAMASGMITP